MVGSNAVSTLFGICQRKLQAMAWATRWNALLEEKSSDSATSARIISKTFSFSEFTVSGILTHPVNPPENVYKRFGEDRLQR